MMHSACCIGRNFLTACTMRARPVCAAIWSEKCREISGAFLLFLFPQETKLESAQNFSRQISRHFSPDPLQLQKPNFMPFFTLQTLVPEKCIQWCHGSQIITYWMLLFYLRNGRNTRNRFWKVKLLTQMGKVIRNS